MEGIEEGEKIVDFRGVVKETVIQCGGAFSVGVLVGGIFYFGSGCWLSPRGKRFMGGLCHVRDRATLLGGSVAMWSFVFNAARGSLCLYR